MKKLLILFSLLLFPFVCIKAQDTLFLSTGDTMTAFVKQVGIREITVRTARDINSAEIVFRKSEVYRIHFESGTRLIISEMKGKKASTNHEFNSRKSCFSVEIFSLPTNDLCIGYAHFLKNGNALEFKLARIGIGNSDVEDYGRTEATGWFAKAGYRYSALSQGKLQTFGVPFLKAELTYSNFTTQDETYNAGALQLLYGTGIVLGSRLFLEAYGGIGLSYINLSHEKRYQYYVDYMGNTITYPYYVNDRSYYYGFSDIGDGHFTFAISGGVTLGFAF